MNNLEILYEDNHIIVAIKPCNILSQADNTNDIDMVSIIKRYLKEKYNKPGNVYVGLVHRLDRPVSGIMVFAKTSKAASRLSEQIRTHEFKKSYLAVVNGILLKKSGELVNYIVKQKDNSSIISVNNEGKLSRLFYKVIEENKVNNLSLVNINLQTGRHHQIRVQFANIKHPLYGDQRYGEQNKAQIALYAYKVQFIHPVKKESMIFERYPDKKDVWKLFKSVKQM